MKMELNEPIKIFYEINILPNHANEPITIATYKDFYSAKQAYRKLIDGIDYGTYLSIEQIIMSDLDYFDTIYTTLISNSYKNR